MPEFQVNRVGYPKRIIGKMDGRGGGEAQWVSDPPPEKKTRKGPCEYNYLKIMEIRKTCIRIY
jgi:hypothetical protein